MDSSLINDDELDEFLDDINTSTPNADNSDLSSNLLDASIDSNGEESSTLLIDGVEYVETKTLARLIRKGNVKKTSPIWKIGIKLKRVDNDVNFWQCTVCKKMKKKSTLYKTSATSAAFRHLKKEHGIIESNGRFIQVKQPNSGALTLSIKSKNSPVILDFN